MATEKKRLIIIDSNSLIHRAYHALPRLATKKGELVNAVYGFLLVFLRAIRELQPDYLAAAFDVPAPTFRHEKFKGYKAKRPKAPDELYEQIPKVKEILKAFNVPVFEKAGFEADDIVGTISQQFNRKQVVPPPETIIISGDTDVLQLVDKNTKAYILRKGVKDVILYDENLVKEKYEGLTPGQLDDYKALRGDPTDDVPGAKGIGEKIAIDLIKEFNSLEELYQELEKNSEKAQKIKPKIKEILLNQKEEIFLSKILVQIKRDVPIEYNLKDSSWTGYNKEKIIEILRNYEFFSLLGRLPVPGEKTEESLADIISREKSKNQNNSSGKRDSFKDNLRLW